MKNWEYVKDRKALLSFDEHKKIEVAVFKNLATGEFKFFSGSWVTKYGVKSIEDQLNGVVVDELHRP